MASTTWVICGTLANLGYRESLFGAAGVGAADAARELNERFESLVDIDHVALLVDLEPRRGLLVVLFIERERVIIDDLDRRVDLLDLDRDRHRRELCREIIVDVHGVLAGDDAANADGLLPDRAVDLAAVHGDRIVESAAIVAVERQEAGLAFVIPHDIAERILDIEVDVVGVVIRPAHGDDE